MPDAEGNPTAEEAAAAAAAAAQHQADTAALQAELDQVKARAFELEVGALKAANPDLPDPAFSGDDLAAVQATVAIARAAADHTRQTIEAAKNGPAANPAVAAAIVAAAAGAGAGTQRKPEVPTNVRGISRIAFALRNPGPGMTE